MARVPAHGQVMTQETVAERDMGKDIARQVRAAWRPAAAANYAP